MSKLDQTIKVFDDSASKYEEKYIDQSHIAKFLNQFCNSIFSNKAKILDLGCGPGNISKYLFKFNPEFHILGIDLSPRMLELAPKNNHNIKTQMLDVRKISEINIHCDGVVASFCAPYLNKEELGKFFSDISDLLLENGSLYFSTMIGKYQDSSFVGTENSKDKLFTYLHQQDYIERFLRQSNLKIVDLGILNVESHDTSGFPELHLVARKESK